MNQQAFFTKIIEFLNHHKIKYMLTGSVGAILYSRPRLTNDMDIVVMMFPKEVETFINEFSSDDYFVPDRTIILDEIQNNGQFNLIHISSGSKIDFIIRKNSDFACEEFDRRINVLFSEGIFASSATPEDIIISKMKYYQMGKSSKHIEDISAILDMTKEELDLAYIASWAKKLSLTDVWSQCTSNSNSPE